MSSTTTQVSYEHRILSALRRVIRAVDIYSRKLNTKFGLTTPQLLCLDAISDSREMTLTDLAKTVNLGVSTVNGIIDRLEAKKLITRKRASEDRRKVSLEMTLTGTELVLKAPSLLQDKFVAALSQLPDSEQMTITESLERIVELMNAEKVDASPNLFPGEQIVKTANKPSPKKEKNDIPDAKKHIK